MDQIHHTKVSEIFTFPMSRSTPKMTEAELRLGVPHTKILQKKGEDHLGCCLQPHTRPASRIVHTGSKIWSAPPGVLAPVIAFDDSFLDLEDLV